MYVLGMGLMNVPPAADTGSVCGNYRVSSAQSSGFTAVVIAACVAVITCGTTSVYACRLLFLGKILAQEVD
jgi:hypothetical protein